MKSKTIRVITKEPYKEAVVAEISNDLETFRSIVDGYIEVLLLPTNNTIDIILNEEGKLFDLDGNFYIPEHEDCIVGSCFLASHDEEGNFTSLNDDQIAHAMKYINSFKIEEGFDLYNDLDLISAMMKKRYRVFEREMESEEL